MANPSFVGVVTRKEVKTGLTLQAKIVSPSGKKTSTKNFKCMVKSTGMSDLSSCIADLNETISGIHSKRPENLCVNLTPVMPATGTHGTTIGYRFESESESMLSEFISEDGILKKRPNYGAKSVIGSLTVTVSKGKEKVQSKVTIIITPYELDEILAKAQDRITWDTIRNTNASESNDLSSGTKNVKNPLNLIKSIQVEGSDTPLTVTWAVVDAAQGYSEGQSLYTGTRIDPSTGEIQRPSYTGAYKLYSLGNSAYNCSIVAGTVPCVRIGGITLTATVSVSGSEHKVTKTFSLCTLSKYLTNSEVANYLLQSIRVTIPSTNMTYASMDASSNSSITLSEGGLDNGKVQITIPSNTVGFGEAPTLGLTSVSASVTCTLREFSNASAAKIYSAEITEGFVVNNDTGITSITFDLSKAHNISSDDKKFCIACSIDVWAYSANGVVLGGESSTSKAYWKFTMSTL